MAQCEISPLGYASVEMTNSEIIALLAMTVIKYMPIIHESIVFQTTYNTLKNFHAVRRAFSKSERYSLGEKIENSLLEILLAIIEAGNAKREWKISAINAALRYLEKSKILIRLAYDLEQIREKNYLDLEENLNKIGRMLGGWRKAV